MHHHSPMIELSSIDEKIFHVRTARAALGALSDLPDALKFCHANKAMFLIARCSASRQDVVQAMGKAGFLLMETMICYNFDLTRSFISATDTKISVRTIRPDEASQVYSIARESFKGYFGHYHADPRLDRKLCDEIYASWAMNACISKDVADDVLVATEDDKTILGFLTLKIKSGIGGTGVLMGISPESQGRGIGRALSDEGNRWYQERKCRQFAFSTHIANIALQKILVHSGFDPSRAYYTFHKWFE